MSSPLDHLVDERTVAVILDDLYTRLFDDPMVGFLFVGHDKQRIVRMQTAFTLRLLGDTSAPYDGKSIPDAHAALPILPGHFDRRHHLLAQTLAAHGVPPDVRALWLERDRALRPAVLRCGQAASHQLLAREPDDDEPAPAHRDPHHR